MLTLLKRWLGWEEDSDFYGMLRPNSRPRPNSATAHLFAKEAAENKQPISGSRASHQDVSSRPAPQQVPKQTKQTKQTKPAPAAKQAVPGVAPKRQPFDPYNTGKFDRSASWERISKNQR
jgi:hypothetical protein